jgi:hypothetical protein
MLKEHVLIDSYCLMIDTRENFHTYCIDLYSVKISTRKFKRL